MDGKYERQFLYGASVVGKRAEWELGLDGRPLARVRAELPGKSRVVEGVDRPSQPIEELYEFL